MGIDPSDLAEEIIKRIAIPGDNFMIDKGYVSYSRYCAGGAYQYVGEFRIRDDVFVSYMGGYYEQVDLRDPDSFEKLANLVRRSINGVQTERTTSGFWKDRYNDPPRIVRR